VIISAKKNYYVFYFHSLQAWFDIVQANWVAASQLWT